MNVHSDLVTLGISLALGLLVGMQREHSKSQVAGFRTFALITVLGTLCALLAQSLGGWIVVAGLVGVSLAMAMANIIKLRTPVTESGATTEVAGLVMFIIGAYLVYGSTQVAVVLTGAVAVLLYAKPIMHGLVRRMAEPDMRAIMQWVLIALVILPILPDRPYGPFQSLNPREIWWIVVLVVSISFAGYIALKLFGQNAGAVLAGLLGGVISSTATTVSYARRSATDPAHVNAATLVIMLASTVVYVRVLVEIGAVARSVLPSLAGPIAIMLVAAALLSFIVWLRNRKVQTELPPQDDPSELKAAITFGIMYALVTVAVAAAKHYFGSAGIYAVAGISGLTDMDAITLSTAQMVAHDQLASDVAWRAILIAAIANLAFKTGIVALLGGRALLSKIAPLFGLNVAVGIIIFLWWPAPGVDSPDFASTQPSLDSVRTFSFQERLE
ncbi:MAG: MgtC/SapB family protein [Phycisphaerales bacterium]|nr:MgtC/SapB family protein [Phycisphaerales bacterium]